MTEDHNPTIQRARAHTIDEGLRSYMLRVYNYMAMGVALIAVVTLLMANMPGAVYTVAVTPLKWVVFAALLGMGWFSPKILTMQNPALAQAYYWIYAALWGVLIAPMIFVFLNIENGVYDIARAFFITTGMFAGMSILGYTTKKDLTAFGSFLFMVFIGLIITILIQVIFFSESSLFSLLVSGAAVLLMAGMTAYETQVVKDMYLQNSRHGGNAVSRMAVFGALMILGNFVVMFIHILNILGIMRD